MTEAAGALWTVMNSLYLFPPEKHCLVCWEMENLLEASLGAARCFGERSLLCSLLPIKRKVTPHSCCNPSCATWAQTTLLPGLPGQAVTAVLLRRWFRSPPVFCFSSLVPSQWCFCTLRRRAPPWQDFALCSWRGKMEVLRTAGQTLTPVSSTHAGRRCLEWDLSSPSDTATAPNCSCSQVP